LREPRGPARPARPGESGLGHPYGDIGGRLGGDRSCPGGSSLSALAGSEVVGLKTAAWSGGRILPIRRGWYQGGKGELCTPAPPKLPKAPKVGSAASTGAQTLDGGKIDTTKITEFHSGKTARFGVENPIENQNPRSAKLFGGQPVDYQLTNSCVKFLNRVLISCWKRQRKLVTDPPYGVDYVMAMRSSGDGSPLPRKIGAG
jgi:hypothetical protein